MQALERMRRWVAEHEAAGLNRTQVAALIGCSEGGLSRVLSGTRGVGGRMAALIERATEGWHEGAIRAVDWYETADPMDATAEG